MNKLATRLLFYSCFVACGLQHVSLIIPGSCLSYQKRYQKNLKELPQETKDEMLLNNAKRNLDGSLEGNLVDLIGAGADVHKRWVHTRTVLHEAVRAGSVSSVRILLANGAECDDLDFFNCSPLHYAASQCNVALVKLLLDVGADKSVRNKQGRTPQQEAQLSRCGPKIAPLLSILSQ